LDYDAGAKALRIAQAAQDRRAENTVVLDMRDLMSICDYFVICSGRSRLHVDAIADEVDEVMEAEGESRRHREGIPDSTWVIVDYGDVVVHVFEPEARGFYNLEGLWHDAARLELPTREEPDAVE